jgi:serine-type D-Ala-D-Ala carboxypeptidase/endopeptidase (penicillin-binding protein 4)
MSIRNTTYLYLHIILCAATFPLYAASKPLPEKMTKIMRQPKYRHSTWGIYVKDAETGQVLYDLNSEQMFLPASTTKLFSVAALLNAYGDNYRFKTPIYAVGTIENGRLNGDLILVAQGDLTMGGRQDGTDKIDFTKLDHINANYVPGTTLTKEDPLYGFKDLAKQVRSKGIKEIDGDVMIDDSLFKSKEKRDMIISPIMVNENMIDFVINPSEIGNTAIFAWRPQVEGYTVDNQVKTGSKDDSLDIDISSNDLGRNIVVKGTIPIGQKDIVRTFSIKDPKHFAQATLVTVLKDEGIIIKANKKGTIPNQDAYKNLQPIAVWTSPPLYEYAKLILKVSHNLGANLVPLLLAVKKGEKTFEEGMLDLGKFVMDDVKLPSDVFVFGDGAGGDENRLTPIAEVELLDYMRKQPKEEFQNYFNALPILGVDGSLEDFAKNTDAVGKVRAKPGTGVFFNLATGKLFLTTQALAGYVEGKSGRLIEFMISVNNGNISVIDDVFPIFEDLSEMTAIIYDEWNEH